jgi:hypothetical protein
LDVVAVGDPGRISNVRVTVLAAAKVELPLWLAVIEQVPPATKVIRNPETVQIEVVLDAIATVNPEVDVGATSVIDQVFD